MAISDRVHQPDFSEHCQALGTDYMADLVGTSQARWRIYECYHTYTQGTGGDVRKGEVVRHWEHTAGELEGQIAEFATLAEAEKYFDLWLKPHERNTNSVFG